MRGTIIIAALASSCVMHKAGEERSRNFFSEAKTVCEITSNPAIYLGRRLIIKGVLFEEPHERLLYDESCRELDLSVSHSLRLNGNQRAKTIVKKFRKKHPTVRVPVVYSGIVTVNVVIRGCTKSSCYRYSLEESQLLAASPQSQVPSERK